MTDAPTTGEAVQPPELPTTIADRLHEIHFSAEGASREETFAELCDQHPEWADAMREYRAAIAAGESVIGRVTDAVEEPRLPDRIGKFRILELLGEGGFGVVYRAEQHEPVRRTIALKVLRAGRIDNRARLRFELERQTLARMQHDGIAQVYDAGQTDDGLLYFSMEFVDGKPLTAWCDERRLDIDGRLELFLRVCAAVQHAHQRGVVHRDLKPGNVLVREADEHAIAKVIDFGVAKLVMDDELGDLTMEGAMVGTPGYMSPEQAIGGTIDTRTDVYALGVMLYELLAGDLPFDRTRLRTANAAEIARIIGEEDPERLTASVQSSDSAEVIAERRGCNVDALVKTLRGDLEWIVRKALAKDPDHRYASVSALIGDVERYQRDEPVSAREPAALYLLRKFVARHRLGVGVGLGSAIIAAGVIVGLVLLLSEVDGARQLAEERGRLADKQRDIAVGNEYTAHLAAARAALQVGRANAARSHLLAAAPELRGWEWRHLANQCDTSARTFAAELSIHDVFWLGDDDRLMILYLRDGGEVRNVRTGKIEARLTSLGENNRAVYDRQNQRLIVLIDWKTLRIWEAGSWDEPVHEIVSDVPIRYLALSPDCRTLLTSDNDGAVHCYDLDRELEPRILYRADRTEAVTVFPDGARFATSLPAAVQIHDLATGTPILTLPHSLSRCTALVATDETLYGASGSRLMAWDADRGALVADVPIQVRLSRLQVSEDGRTLYGAGYWAQTTVMAWDASTLEVVSRFHGHREPCVGLDLHPDGRRIATGSKDGTARIWPATATPSVTQLNAGVDARQLDVSPSGRALATADFSGLVTVWDAESLETTVQVDTGIMLAGCALGEDRAYVAGRQLLAVDCRSGAIREGDPPEGFIDKLLADDREQWLAGVSESGQRLSIWRLPSMESVHTIGITAQPKSLAYDRERGVFVVGSTDDALRFVDPAIGRIVETRPSPTLVFNVAVAGDGLAIASTDLQIVDGDREPARLAAHTLYTFGVAFSPDGQRIATGGADALVRLWDRQGTELLVLDGSPWQITQVAYAASGRRLLGLSHQWSQPTYVLVWDAPPEVMLAN